MTKSTEGVLRITNARGFENKDDNTIAIMRNGIETFETLPVPAEYTQMSQLNDWTYNLIETIQFENISYLVISSLHFYMPVRKRPV